MPIAFSLARVCALPALCRSSAATARLLRGGRAAGGGRGRQALLRHAVRPLRAGRAALSRRGDGTQPHPARAAAPGGRSVGGRAAALLLRRARLGSLRLQQPGLPPAQHDLARAERLRAHDLGRAAGHSPRPARQPQLSAAGRMAGAGCRHMGGAGTRRAAPLKRRHAGRFAVDAAAGDGARDRLHATAALSAVFRHARALPAHVDGGALCSPGAAAAPRLAAPGADHHRAAHPHCAAAAHRLATPRPQSRRPVGGPRRATSRSRDPRADRSRLARRRRSQAGDRRAGLCPGVRAGLLPRAGERLVRAPRGRPAERRGARPLPRHVRLGPRRALRRRPACGHPRDRRRRRGAAPARLRREPRLLSKQTAPLDHARLFMRSR